MVDRPTVMNILLASHLSLYVFIMIYCTKNIQTYGMKGNVLKDSAGVEERKISQVSVDRKSSREMAAVAAQREVAKGGRGKVHEYTDKGET